MAMLVISALLLVGLVCQAFYTLWWKPMKLQKYLRKQGIPGPSYKLFGNLVEIAGAMKEALTSPMEFSHDYAKRVHPFEAQMFQKYGKVCVIWYGTTPKVHIMDPDLVKDMLSNRLLDYVGKLKGTPLTDLLATGIVSYVGEKWVKHRRIISPAFHMEKLKVMLPAFHTSSTDMISRWENLVREEFHEVDVVQEFHKFTGDAISRTAFGSNFEEGERIFHLQTEQTSLVLQVVQSLEFFLPGSRFLPTKRNKRIKQIAREVRALLINIINKRRKAMENGHVQNDLLGLMLESNLKEIQDNANSKNVGMNINEIIEECKLFYIAGQETTSSLLVWTMVALGMHPEWQVKAREEILRVFGNRKPEYEELNQLKTVTMILNEVLRLYPPSHRFMRTIRKTMNLGGYRLTPDVEIVSPLLFVHHSREFWGDDALEFNPERFSGGISKASNRVSFFPFGGGPRICIGQNFAMIESKLVLTMILQRFSFELSPTYVHAPYGVFNIYPQHGAQIRLHKL